MTTAQNDATPVQVLPSPLGDAGAGGLLNMLLPLLGAKSGDVGGNTVAVEALAQAIQSLSSTNAQLLVELRDRREDALYWRRRAEKLEATATPTVKKTASVRAPDDVPPHSTGISLAAPLGVPVVPYASAVMPQY